MNNHPFETGSRKGRCAVCAKKASHILHKQPKPKFFAIGEIPYENGRHFVDARGCFRRLTPKTA